MPAHPLQILVYLGFDLLCSIVLAVALLLVQRTNRKAMMLSIAAPLLLLNASWLKLSLLGEQAQFSDVLLIPDLLRAVPTHIAIAVTLPIGAAAALLLWNLHLLRLGMAATLFTVAAIALQIHAASLIGHAAQTVVDLRGHITAFPTRGHFLAAVTVLQEEIEERRLDLSLARETASPQRLSVPVTARIEPRNVHLIVLESFADPTRLQRFAFRPDPFPPLLQSWRMEAPGYLLAPVFGNRSSNTEFEVLCGLPAFAGRTRVVTMQLERTATPPCLPRLLADQGFRTLSLVPSSPEIFRAGEAFTAMGFGTRWFESNVADNDRDGIWLSAAATLAASRRLQASGETSAPSFVYTFVNAGHHPFERDLKRRPDRIAVEPAHGTVRDWANAVHYTSRAIADHIEEVLRRDPTALILVLGDHQPILGSAFSGYRQGGAIAGVDEEDPLARPALYVTPLIVLDRGQFVRTGALPAWQVPYLILDRLSLGSICVSGSCPHRAEIRLRPTADRVMAVNSAGAEVANCPLRSEEPDCAAVLTSASELRASLVRLMEKNRPDPSDQATHRRCSVSSASD